MKSVGLFATFTLILCTQIARGQQNDLVNNQNTETNSFVSKQHLSQAMGNIPQRYLNQNGKASALSNTINQRQGHVELNTPRPLTDPQKLQQPPDSLKETPQSQPLLQQQQKLPVQHFTQVQQSLPLQQSFQVQQPLQMQQPLGLQQNSLQQVPNFQENTDLKQIPVVQQQTNYQPPSHPQLHLKLQPTNPQGVNIVQPLNTQNVLQPQQNPNLRPAEVITPQNIAPNKNQDIPSVRYHISSQQPPPQSLSNSPVASNPSIGLVPSYNSKPVEQTYIPSYNYINPVPEIQPTAIERKSTNTVQALPTVMNLPSPIVQNTQTPTQAYYYGQTSDPGQRVYVNQNPGYIYPYQTQTSLTAGQVPPIVIKAQPATLQTQPITVQAKPITVQSQPITVQARPDPVKAQPVPLHAQPVPVQAQPTAVISSQNSILPTVPVSMFQTQQLAPQYALSSAYPVNTFLSPTYSTQQSNSLNLKSLLPLIFNLLKEKVASSGCQNSCPCKCKKNDNNDPEVLSGYSSQKRYGVLKDDGPSILNSASEELEGCLRQRKNCAKNEKADEVSDESQENEESDEEEVSDDEED